MNFISEHNDVPMVRQRCLSLSLILIVSVGLMGCDLVKPPIYMRPYPTVPATLAGLIESLRGDNGDIRYAAAWELGYMPEKAIPAIPALEENLFYSNTEVQGIAAWALGEIGSPAECTISSLLQVIEQRRGMYASQKAADALVRFGDSSVVPELMNVLLSTPDSESNEGLKVLLADTIAQLADLPFPDVGGPSYSFNSEGKIALVVAVEEWWYETGSSQKWDDLPESCKPEDFTVQP